MILKIIQIKKMIKMMNNIQLRKKSSIKKSRKEIFIQIIAKNKKKTTMIQINLMILNPNHIKLRNKTQIMPQMILKPHLIILSNQIKMKIQMILFQKSNVEMKNQKISNPHHTKRTLKTLKAYHKRTPMKTTMEITIPLKTILMNRLLYYYSCIKFYCVFQLVIYHIF